MQIRVDKFRRNLALLHPVIPRKPTLEVLSNVMVTDGRIAATDLETMVTIQIPEAQGTFLIPHRSAMELLKYVPGDETLTIEPNHKSIKLTWQGGSAVYDVPEARDYPPISDKPVKAEGTLNGDMVIEALMEALPYCATDTTRPVLNGVTLYLGEVIKVASADGFRLSFQSLKLAYPAEERIIIPSESIAILDHLWHKEPPQVPFGNSLVSQITAVRQLKLSLRNGAMDANYMEASFGNITLVCKLISGTPPDHLLFLSNFHEPNKVRFMAPELLNAVRRLQDIAKDGSGIVRLRWTDTAMTVSAKSEEKGEVSAEIAVQPGSAPGRVALNVAYLREYLGGKSGFVTMGQGEKTAPVLFHYGNKPIVAIMPMFVQWGDETPAEQATEQAESTEGSTESTENGTEPVDVQEEESPEETGEEEPESVATSEVD